MGQVQSTDITPQMRILDEPHGEDESPVYMNEHCFVEAGGQVIPAFWGQPEAKTLIDIMKGSSHKWPNEDCTGERIIYEDGTAGPYRYISYSEFYRRAIAVGRGLLDLGLHRYEKIGIYAHNCQWWQLVAFGAYSVGIIIVPVYDSLGPDAAEYIINHAEVEAIFVSSFKWPNALDVLSKCPKVNLMVHLGDSIPEGDCPVRTLSCTEILAAGEKSTTPNEFAKPDDLAVIMYTSGSSGVPKGCPLTHANIVAGSTGFSCVNMSCSPVETYLSFLPLAHIYALSVELEVLTHGGRVAYARGPVKYLMDDLAAMQPTIMTVVPRVLNKLYSEMMKKLKQMPSMVQKVIYWAIDQKNEARRNNTGHSEFLDMILFSKFREALGGKVRLIVSGGAPIVPEVFEFLCATVTPNILQGYGMTEVSAGVCVQELPVKNPNAVGCCAPCSVIKLRKVPNTDHDPNAAENPTGELLVRGPNVFAGYYKQPELNAEVILPGGWFATGDICRINKDMQVEIIDRAKQLVKLCQGEYISITKLTDLYSMADGISFIFIYADGAYGEPVAILWPTPEIAKKYTDAGVTDIVNCQKLKDELSDNLLAVHKERRMNGFERITTFMLETEEPTVENGMLTPSLKAQYNKIKEKYMSQLTELYKEVSDRTLLSS